MWRFCADPSPDGLAVFGGSLAASASKSDTSGQLTAAMAAQAASIGLRTQSITLLRDAQYRLCEAFVNGGMNSAQLATLQRRFQNIMVADLAIEQLTGYAKPTIVTVGAGGAASADGNLGEAQKALDAGQKDLTTKQADAADAKTKADAATTAYKTKQQAADAAHAALSNAAKNARAVETDLKAKAKKARDDANAKDQAALDDVVTKAPAAQQAKSKKAAADADKVATDAEAAATNAAAVADPLNKTADDADKEAADAKTAADTATKAQQTADKAVSDAQDNLKALKDQVDAARGLTASASPGAPGTVVIPAPSPAASAAIAQSVENIVDKVFKADYTSDSCLDYLMASDNTTTLNPQVVFLCVAKMTVASAKTTEEAKAAVTTLMNSPQFRQAIQIQK